MFTGTARFRLIRHLGSGAMGSVYLVLDEQLGRELALKTLNLASGADLYRFKREFRALADVDHPNLVTLHELISDGTTWFFTMEYVNGVPFDRYVLGQAAVVPAAAEPDETFDEPPADNARVEADPVRLLPSIQQLCAGVNAIHEVGCVHRDLKPTNVLVTESGQVVILDFGLLQQRRVSHRSSAGLSGTPAYMAPEQVLERLCLPAADWYAVGTMIYEVLTGRCPFEGALFDVLLRKQTEDPPPPTTINPDADPLLAELCMRMLRRDENQRPTGREILARLGVAGERAAQPPLRRHTPLGTVALRVPGREPELMALYKAFTRSREGSLAVATVHGASGIGKTCLVENFLDDLEHGQGEPTTPIVLRGHCHERETLPFKAFDNVVDGLSQQLGTLNEDEQAYILPDGILYLSEVFPVLRRLKLTGHKRYFLPPLRDLKELRNQAFLAFCELLRRLARLRPLVIFIDDLQWADRDSYSLLRALTQQPGAPSLLLIAAIRRAPESQRTDPQLRDFESQPDVESVALGPLGPDGTRALIGNLLDGSEMKPAARQQVADIAIRESGGNPFFAVELVHHLRTATLHHDNPSGPIDGRVYSLEAMILERAAGLPDESQAILRVVAVAGDPVPQRVLAAAAGLCFGDSQWERGISALLDQCLVRRTGLQSTDRIEPYHDRIRETVAASLGEDTMHGVHLALARAIEEGGSERPDLLARYWLSADDHTRAKRYVQEAAVEARAKLAFARAAELFRDAAELETDDAARAELWRQAGECHAAVGHPGFAADFFQRAAALGAPRQAAHLQHLAAEQLLRGGQIKQGLEVLGNVLERAGLGYARHPIRALLSVSLRVLWLRLRGLKFRERPPAEIAPHTAERLDILWSADTGLGAVDTLRADDFLLRFLLLALKTGDIRRVAQGLGMLSSQVAALGGRHLVWASALVAESEVLARRSANPQTIGLARMSRAMVRYFTGEFSAAADEFFEVEKFILSNCHGMGWELATSRSFACFALRLSGRVRELCERFDRYTADADLAGDHYLATNLRTYQSIVWLIRDDPDRATRGIKGALDAWPENMYHVQHFFHLYGRCEQALYGEQPETAWHAIKADERRLRESVLLRVRGIRLENAWIRGRVAMAMAEKREPAAREPWLKVAAQSARVLGKAEHQTAVAMGAILDAGRRWLAPRADRAQAIVAIERALATAEAAGSLLIAESVRRWLGEIVGGRKGEEARARSNGWMADQGIQNPARLAHLCAPGFRSPDARPKAP